MSSSHNCWQVCEACGLRYAELDRRESCDCGSLLEIEYDDLTVSAAELRRRFDERFVRTWHFYLAYCEAAFSEGNTDVTQYTLELA